MPEEHSGQIDGVIHLDKPRRLKWSIKGLRELAELQATGEPLDFLGRGIYLGLRWEDPDLTVDQVEDMLDTDNIADAMEAMNQVLRRLNGDGNSNNTPLAGSNSGPSEDMTLDSPVMSSGS